MSLTLLEPACLDRSDELAALRSGHAGRIHSWELVTSVDGPGTRFTMFLAGCPLRCVYCHNPDTMRARGGSVHTSEEVLRRIRRYRSVFQATSGGVTLSGGEPLFQVEFVRTVLRGCRELGVHTALDTSGFLGAKADDELLADIDLVLLDVKSGDEATYRKVTGQSLQPTLDFGDRLAARGTPAWVRFVLVPGWTDADGNVERVADIVAGWGNVERVEVLPFHQLGREKWDSLGLSYRLGEIEPPTASATEAARDVFRSRGITTY